jgi:hypothetical protein
MMFRILFWRGQVHTTLRVFAGRHDGALGLCGDLVMRCEEFDAFRELTPGIQFVDKAVAEPEPETKPKKRGR